MRSFARRVCACVCVRERESHITALCVCVLACERGRHGHTTVCKQVKSPLYSAFNNTNCVKATAQYQNRKIVSQ